MAQVNAKNVDLIAENVRKKISALIVYKIEN
jgi:hypothetical protein